MIDSQQYLALKAVQKHIKQESLYQQDNTQNSISTLILWFKDIFRQPTTRNTSRKRLRRA